MCLNLQKMLSCLYAFCFYNIFPAILFLAALVFKNLNFHVNLIKWNLSEFFTKQMCTKALSIMLWNITQWLTFVKFYNLKEKKRIPVTINKSTE